MSFSGKWAYKGVSDDIDYCQCCGKAELKRVVMIRPIEDGVEDGDANYVGTSCAARILGTSYKKVRDMISAEDREIAEGVAWARKVMVKYPYKMCGDTLKAYRRNNASTRFITMKHQEFRDEVQELLDRVDAALERAGLDVDQEWHAAQVAYARAYFESMGVEIMGDDKVKVIS